MSGTGLVWFARRAAAARPRQPVALAAGLGALLSVAVQAQPLPSASGGFVIRPIPGATPTLSASPDPRPPVRAPGLLGIPPAPGGAPAIGTPPPPAPSFAGQSLTPPPLPSSSADPAPMPGPVTPASLDPSPGVGGQRRQLILTLHQLGAIGPLTLRGVSPLQGVQFGVRADEVVTGATLTLSGAMSPALLPDFSNVTVMLNEQYVGTIPVDREHPKFEKMTMPVSPVFFQDNNRLNFRFVGRYTPECNDPLSGLLWSTISDTSTITLTLERLPPQRDLSRLPLPFFDPHEKGTLSLPFVLPANPSNESLQAAGIAASWFGQLADYRGANFPVVASAPSEGSAVLVVTGSDRPAGVVLPPLNGPTLAVVPNPSDPASSLLVIAGRDGPEAVAAATTLVLGGRTLSGDASTVAAVNVPRRAAYDAPAWIPTDRPVKFGELVDPSDLQVEGWAPGTMRVPFRTAPDLYTWNNRGFPMDLLYIPPQGAIEDLAVSRLDSGINDLYLSSLPLADEPSRSSSWLSSLFNARAAQSSARVDVPPYEVGGRNDLQFFFDARPLHRGDCADVPPPRMAVDPDSTFDISRAYRYAQLPNLAYFINSGFPFTRMADLSETAVVLPQQPASAEVKAYLDLMGRIGSLTGYPVVRLAVVRSDGVQAVADRNIVLIGSLPALGPAADLLKSSPYQVQGNRLAVALPNGLETVRRLFGDPVDDRNRAASVLSGAAGPDSAALVGLQSPLNPARSMVALLGGSPEAVNALVTTLRDPDQAVLVQGDLALLSGGRFTSYRVGKHYAEGQLPFWAYPALLLRQSPIGIVGIIVIALILAALLNVAVRRRVANRNRPVPTRRP